MPNPGRERLSPEAIAHRTRDSINHLNTFLEGGMTINPRNSRDIQAVIDAFIHQVDLPPTERYQGTEVLARLWDNRLMSSNPTMDFIGKHASIVWREVLGKP